MWGSLASVSKSSGPNRSKAKTPRCLTSESVAQVVVTMLVGVPKEIKDNEYRVGLVPSTARELAAKGHQVIVETGAGAGAGLPDQDYAAAGAEVTGSAGEVYARAELIVKVKE